MGGVNSGRVWDDDMTEEDFFNTKPSVFEEERTIQDVVEEVVKAHLKLAGGDYLEECYEDKFSEVVMHQTVGLRMRPVRNAPFGFMTGIQFKGKDILEVTADVNNGLKTWAVPEGRFSFDVYTRLKPNDFETQDKDPDNHNPFRDKDGNFSGISMILILKRPDPPKKRGRPAKDGEAAEAKEEPAAAEENKKAKTTAK